MLTSLSGSNSVTGPSTDWSAILGVACLIGAMLSRAASGVMHECFCKSYSPAAEEIMLFRALFGLPPILLRWNAVREHASGWSLEMWMLLAADLVFDFATKVCLTRVVERASAFTATLVLTTQKFASFCITAAWLGKTGSELWLGASAVLLGTIFYATAPMPVEVRVKSH